MNQIKIFEISFSTVNEAKVHFSKNIYKNQVYKNFTQLSFNINIKESLDHKIKNFEYVNYFNNNVSIWIKFKSIKASEKSQIVWRGEKERTFYLIEIDSDVNNGLADYCKECVLNPNIGIEPGMLWF